MPEEIIEGGTETAPVTPVVVAPVAPVTPAPAQANGSVEWEKQRKGLTADLAKERAARQQFETQNQTFQAELAAERKRIQALVGVTPQNPEETEAAEIRARFGKVFSKEQLLEQMGLSPDDIEDIKAARAERKASQDTQNHYWARHAKEMVKSVGAEIAKEFGDLSERQTDTVTKAYVLRAQSDPEFLARHEAGDPTLAAEFAKEWLGDWYEPAKRKALASEIGQFRRVPNGQTRGIVNQGEKKINVNNNDEVMDLLVAGRQFEGTRR